MVCRRLRDARGPFSSVTRPRSIESCTFATISALAQLGDALVAIHERLGKVVAGVDVDERERKPRRPKRLLGEPQQDDRVLAAGEQQARALTLGRELAQDVDGLVLERPQVGSSVRPHRDDRIYPFRASSAMTDVRPFRPLDGVVR